MMLNGKLKEKIDMLKHWKYIIKKIDSIDLNDNFLDP